jgi:hypothetical protein
MESSSSTATSCSTSTRTTSNKWRRSRRCARRKLVRGDPSCGELVGDAANWSEA